MAVKAVVVCNGGVVQDILVSDADVTVAVIDYDTEGADPDRMTAIPQRDGTNENAYASVYRVEVNPTRVDELLAAINREAAA